MAEMRFIWPKCLLHGRNALYMAEMCYFVSFTRNLASPIAFLLSFSLKFTLI
mgnify:CR=1 FL=1